ncbi:MAG: hypothetical protein ACKVOH_04155 [Chlamydiales bacterium]
MHELLEIEQRGEVPPGLEQSKTGAVPLFKQAFFPWGALPYPKEHAQLGYYLAQLGEREIAQRMGEWQRGTLDFQGRPLFSLFLQERGATFAELVEANARFFQVIDLVDPVDHFVDHELGIVRINTKVSTQLGVATGCKSGMGAFLYRDIGVVNFGPQLLPLGECCGFGLAGKPLQCEVAQNRLEYTTRLAAPLDRSTEPFHLQDSGFSGLWLEAALQFHPGAMEFAAHFAGLSSLDPWLFSFFLKAQSCLVSGSHKLSPRSLDRYKGPSSTIAFFSEQGRMEIDMQGCLDMEIIPLAGDDSFWGADFLVAFRCTQDVTCLISIDQSI